MNAKQWNKNAPHANGCSRAQGTLNLWFPWLLWGRGTAHNVQEWWKYTSHLVKSNKLKSPLRWRRVTELKILRSMLGLWVVESHGSHVYDILQVTNRACLRQKNVIFYSKDITFTHNIKGPISCKFHSTDVSLCVFSCHRTSQTWEKSIV